MNGIHGIKLCAAAVAVLAGAVDARCATYYVDCAGGSDTNIGTSVTAAWRTPAKVSGITFAPGDSILLRRGTECRGQLWPKGSGAQDHPITIGAYGSGPLPIIRGEADAPVVKLHNQQHWHIENIESSGGSPYGIFISGDRGVLRHFRIRDVVVHDVGGTAKTKDSGLIAVVAGGKDQTFDDVVIDGVTAYNTTQWAGIVVNGAAFTRPQGSTVRARNATIRNSVVHDVYGDGIILFQVSNGLIEKCVTWNTGMEPTQTIGTPNAIWTWKCNTCTVQFNEGFFADSPGVDGGVYDIDWGNENNIIQYNYAHDSQGYCASVFGAGNLVTTNSVVRYNLCVNNGRSPRLAKRQGEIFLSTWDGGKLDGVRIYGNTIYWNPPVEAPVVFDQADYTGKKPNFFKNNLIYSTVRSLVKSTSSMKLDHNLYWYGGTGEPEWLFGGTLHRGFARFGQATGQEAHGSFAEPKLVLPELTLAADSPAVNAGDDVGNMGKHDLSGFPIPQGGAFDIGALEYTGPMATGSSGPAPAFALKDTAGFAHTLGQFRGEWLLLSFLEQSDGDASASRTQAVFLKSVLYQHGNQGLKVAVVARAGVAGTNVVNQAHDWRLRDIPLLLDESGSVERGYGVTTKPSTFLIAPAGQIVRRWNGFASAAQLGLTLRWLIGPPPGTPPVSLAR
ncbi:MAG TPA: redoxin domain-containing protein [Bryobacteraceae bacterium]|nr:redoxin domain-containing protein [Bryobacteraceae bacterium]